MKLFPKHVRSFFSKFFVMISHDSTLYLFGNIGIVREMFDDKIEVDKAEMAIKNI